MHSARQQSVNTMHPFIIGIDPGQGGALAISWKPGNLECHPTPTNSEGEMLDHFKDVRTCALKAGVEVYVYTERIGGYIKGAPRGGHAMFVMGRSYEYGIALASAFGFPLIRVEPVAWQQYFEVPQAFPLIPKKKWYEARKAAIYDIGKARYPHAVRLIAKTADAALICEYGRSFHI